MADEEIPTEELQPVSEGKTNGLAIASLVLGLLFFVPFAALVAIILGFVALSKIKKDPSQKGKGMAITGIVLGFVFILLLPLLFMIGSLAYFGVLSPDRFLPEKCVLVGGFSCVDFKLDTRDSEIRIEVMNNLGVTAENVELEINTNYCSIQGNNPSEIGTMENRDRTTVTYRCEKGFEDIFQGDLILRYTREGSSTIETSTGSISGTLS